MIKQKIKKDAYKIVKRYYKEDDLVHGIPHIVRMLENLRQIRKENNDSNSVAVLDSVELSIVFHDIAKDMETSDKKHGQIAIEILNEDYPKLFHKIPNKEWVEYSIKGHTDGEMIKRCKIPDSRKKICLALLLALDNIDAIGKTGVYRDLRDFRDNFNWISDKNSTNIAFLKRLLKNYYYIDDNINRIKSIENGMKTEFLLGLYEKLKNEQESYIFKLIKEKELKILDSEIKKFLNRKIDNIWKRNFLN
jgi:hypothetical protein